SPPCVRVSQFDLRALEILWLTVSLNHPTPHPPTPPPPILVGRPHSVCLVAVPGKIQKGPDSVKVKVGQTVKLVAHISGEPEPDVGWAKDGEDVEEDDRLFYDIDEDTTTLTIKNVTKADAGKYEVFVENSLGMDQSFARVDVI
ncbi:SPEG neighbor protein-like, partial [Rhincodon typus]|uniref:SPEG neighbor protein-like n=1 Tax=Rhincodon typus TaxID=259920 RepID=UPI0020305440